MEFIKHKTNDWFSIVVLPDSQRYVEDSHREERLICLEKQVSWIIKNSDVENIRFVSHVGDYVHNRNSVAERESFFEVIDKLKGKLPFGISAGNHDLLFGERAKEVLKGREKIFNYELFDQPEVRRVRDMHFSENIYSSYDYWISSCNDCQSNAQIFKASDKKYVIIHIEFSPSDITINWANDILKKHADLPAIITTHSFITPEEKYGITTRNSRLSTYQKDMVGEGDNAGTDILTKLIEPNKNVFMIFCGHYADQRYVVLKVDNREVHALLSDYELEKPYYGNGWMRVLRFFPMKNKVCVETYSPLLDEYKTDSKNKFEIEINEVGFL